MELRVDSAAHLNAHVARSASGTIRIPELEATMEPGSPSEAFVNNVEGALHRFGHVARGAVAITSDDRERASAETALARLDRLIAGREPFTFVIDGPTGKSDILHTDVLRRALTPEEIADLRTPESPSTSPT